MNNQTSETLTTEIVGRLEALYPKLSSDEPSIRESSPDVPALTDLTGEVAKCSFKVFSDPVDYLESERAKPRVVYPGPGIRARDRELYRVFFNDFSNKIYVDVNEVKWAEEKKPILAETLYCEILKTLIFVLACDIAKPPEEEGSAEVVTLS